MTMRSPPPSPPQLELENVKIIMPIVSDKCIFSHDVIRIMCNKEYDPSFIYAFMRTKTGNALIRTNEYGAVVSHIEPVNPLAS
jgi:hypothetical protein